MLGQRLDQQRLGQPGHAGEQAVPAGEERDQHLIDHLVLPDDHQPQLLEDPRPSDRDPGREILAMFFHRVFHCVPWIWSGPASVASSF